MNPCNIMHVVSWSLSFIIMSSSQGIDLRSMYPCVGACLSLS